MENYYENLLNGEGEITLGNYDIFNETLIDNEIEDSIFNAEITDEENLYAVKSLRRGECPGEDNIILEFFIRCFDILLPFF